MEKEFDRRPRPLTTKDLADAAEPDRAELSAGGRPMQSAIGTEHPTLSDTNKADTHPPALPPAVPLVEQNVARDFQGRWDTIQVSFVDEPRKAVESADNLVAETMKQLADRFAAERTNLESQWDRGDQVS